VRLIETSIPGPLIIEPSVFTDQRGFFIESWNTSMAGALGVGLEFVQDSHSRSGKGVLRGLHFQNPNPQGKLVRVVGGRIWDVAVDIRRSSSHFGEWVGTELSAANKRILWVPPGFAHGFVSLERDTDVLYKCTAPYDPASEHSLLWSDPNIAIEWPLDGLDLQLSARDRAAQSLDEIEAFG
jgi:dTDP-4-dehydrorhamnose 3,5-epimerase